jgi:hypothetical protein
MGVYHSRKRTRVYWRGAIIWFSYNFLNEPWRINWVHGEPGGGPVLKTEASWRTINGIVVRTRNSQTFLHWRRLPKYLRSSG